MKESVAIVKEANKKKKFSPTRGDNNIQGLRNKPERQLGSLVGLIGNIRSNGGKPSVENIAMQLSGMHSAERAPALLALQQTHGNRHVQQVVAGIQAKLRIGQPGDVYEQEADRVADEVMRMPEPGVQRQVEPEEEEEEILQTKPLVDQITPLVQRQVEEEEEEEEIQTKPLPSQTSEVVSDVETSINSIRGGGQPLPGSIRAFFEPRFGQNFSQVRVHTDARAFTMGHDIVFGAGEYTPGTTVGKQLLAHELTHVVQQTGGQAPDVIHLNPINPDNDSEVLQFMKRLNGESAQKMIESIASKDQAVRDAIRRNLVPARGEIHEERMLLCLAAVKLRGTIRASDFKSRFAKMFDALRATHNDGDVPIILGYVDPQVKVTMMPKFPGDVIKSADGNHYVVLRDRVRRKGDSAWCANNPGNLTADKNFPEAWNYGAYRGKNLFGRFVIFPTLDDGWNGLKKWMEARKEKTVWVYTKGHAPSSEPGNDPALYAQILVRHVFGVPRWEQQMVARKKTVKQLLETGWPAKLKLAFNEAEGYKPGEELGFYNPSLPTDVGPAVRAGRETRRLSKVAKTIVEANK